MGEMTNTSAEKAPKKSWLKGMKTEFKKIVWPDKETLSKQSIAVIAVTIALGIVIYILDFIIELGVGFLIR